MTEIPQTAETTAPRPVTDHTQDAARGAACCGCMRPLTADEREHYGVWCEDCERKSTYDVAPAPPPVAVPDDVRREAGFLLDRLREFEGEHLTDEGARDWHGHVSPSVARLRTLIAAQPASPGDGAKEREPHIGWLFHNPDTGTEWSENHPIESGECDDAEGIRPATLGALHDEMLSAWKSLDDERRESEAQRARIPAEVAYVTERRDHYINEAQRLALLVRELGGDPEPSTARPSAPQAGTEGGEPSPISTRDYFPERRGDWMQTYTGRRFWPLDPRPEDVCIEDIAHALSLACRYGGHCLRFYSVAEHCVHLARVASPAAALWLLLHDGSEAYISDVVRPLKRHMPEYRTAEGGVTRAVYEAFDLNPDDEPAEVKALDNRILMDERAQVMRPTDDDWHYGGAAEPLGVTLEFWSPERAEREFLATFSALTGRTAAAAPSALTPQDGATALRDLIRQVVDCELAVLDDQHVGGSQRKTDRLETEARAANARLEAALAAPPPEPATPAAHPVSADGLREAMTKALDGQTRWSRDCHLSGEYLCGLVWPLVCTALARPSADAGVRGAASSETLRADPNAVIAVALHMASNGDGSLLAKLGDEHAAIAAPPDTPDTADRGGWLPIETAPKDGTHILASKVDSRPIRAFFESERWWMHGCGPWGRHVADLTGDFAPSHWMPLPVPPASDAIPSEREH